MTNHPPAKKRKMSKADPAQAMSAAFLYHLNESEEKLFAREEQLLQMQREWEKEAELQHRQTSVGNDQGDAGNATGCC